LVFLLGRVALAGRVTLSGRDTTGEGVEGDWKDWVGGVGENCGTLGVTAAGCLALFAANLTGSLGNVGLGAGVLGAVGLGAGVLGALGLGALGLGATSLGLGGSDLMPTWDLGCSSSSLLGFWGLLGSIEGCLCWVSGLFLLLNRGSSLGLVTTLSLFWPCWNTLLKSCSSGLSLSASACKLLKASRPLLPLGAGLSLKIDPGVGLPLNEEAGVGVPLKADPGLGLPLKEDADTGVGLPLKGKRGWGVVGLKVVAITGIGLRVVDLVVDGLNGGLEGFSIGLLSSIRASSVSSSSTNSALKLGLVKNKSDARIFGDWVVCLFVCSGTAGRALNVVVGTNWSSNANPFSSGCDC